jgi:cytochrome c oxidase accessory protein FixG
MFSDYFIAKKKLYPQLAKGRFRKLKNKLNILFLGIYCLSPFLRFNRGDNISNQAILIDIPNGRAYFFFIEIWPSEVYYLAAILIILAVALFFITSLFGRIWCGYACFQTVWSDIFIMVERFFQGDRNSRIILDRKNNFNKFYRKTLTHLTWIIIALLTGLVFCSYFSDSFALYGNLFSLNISSTILGWSIGIAGMTYLMAGFAREHVCTFMCPYARFQSAMFDDNTLIISYDEKRGEPRDKYRQEEDFTKRGHCIDCKQCVVVCPTGIDIRNGLQMECINCGLCIDACDSIMEKIGLPKGLIRYDTSLNLSDPKPKNKFKIWRLRTFYYLIILISVCSLTLYSLVNKTKIDFSVSQERNPLYVKLSDGSIRNGYYLKITNKTHHNKYFTINIVEPYEASLKIQNNNENFVKVNAESSFIFKFFVTIPSQIISLNKENRAFVIMGINSKNSELTKQENSQLQITKNELLDNQIKDKNLNEDGDINEKISIIFIGD